ncbi:hypothetical protein AAMO2058_000446900 [Amorphochlora amoebiformis]
MASNQIRSIRTHEACPSRRRKRKLHAQPILTEPKVQPMRFHSVIDPKLMVTSHSTPEMPTVNCTKSSQVPPTKSPPPPIRVSRKADGSESNGKVKKVGRRGGTRSRQGLSKKKGLTSDLLSTESTFPDAHVAQVDWPKPLPMQGIIIEPDPSYARENLQVPKPLRLLNLIVPQRNSSAVAERVKRDHVFRAIFFHARCLGVPRYNGFE